MERHRYGEHELQEFSHVELLVKENNHERMIPELADYLLDVWSGGRTRKINREQANKKALDILEGEPRRTDIPPKWHNTSNISRYGLIKEAVEKGYLESFRIKSPWHPKDFLDSKKMTTYPFQHEEMIFYRADNREIFFERKHTGRTEKEQISVLKKGYLSGENGFGPMDNAFDPDEHDLPHGVYGSFLKIAKEYRPEVIFELKVPTSDVVVHYKKNNLLENLKEVHETFGSPEEMREEAKRADMNNELINFFAAREIPLEMVNGIWDVENFNKPIFEPLSKYVKNVKQEERFSIDEDSMPEFEDRMEYEVYNLRKLASSLDEMMEALEGVKQLFEKRSPEFFVRDEVSSHHFRRLKGSLRKYDRAHSEFLRTCEHIFKRDGIDEKVPDIESYEEFVSDLNQIISSVEELDAEAKKAYQKEYRYLEDFETGKMNKDEASNEEKFRKAINREIIDKSLKLPCIEPMEEKLVANRRKARG